MTYHTTACAEHEVTDISHLESVAWAAWNASYHVPTPESYRALSRWLYERALHERIQTLFADLDRQNAELDARLLSHEAADGERADRGPSRHH